MSEEVNIFTLMATGQPYKSFIKTIVGKVSVTTLNEVDEKSLRVAILKGSPKKHGDDAIIDLWSEKQYQLFKKLNSFHIQSGTIKEYVRPTEQIEGNKERSIAEWTDDEIFKNILSAKFQTFQAAINGIDQVPLLYRLYTIANDRGMKVSTVKRLVARISEVQGMEFIPEDSEFDEEE